MLKKALTTAIELSSQHKRAQAEPLLRMICEIVQSNQEVELHPADMWLLAKALLVWYQYDNFEQEQERLNVLGKAYLYAQKTIDACEQMLREPQQPALREPQQPTLREPQQPEAYYEALLVQIIILHNCNEDFETIVAEVYNKCMKAIDASRASATDASRTSATDAAIIPRVAQKAVLRILYNTIVKIDDAFENFHHNEWIEKLCNTIEIENSDLTPQQLVDAEKIQKTICRNLN